MLSSPRARLRPTPIPLRGSIARPKGCASRPPAGVRGSSRRRRHSPRRCCRWSTSRSSSTASRKRSRPASSRSSSSPRPTRARSRITSTSTPSSSTSSRRRARSRSSARSGAISNLAQLAYVRQKEQLGLGHAILMAKDLIGHEPFAVLLPDDVVIADRPCIGQLIHAYERTHASVVAVMRGPRRRGLALRHRRRGARREPPRRRPAAADDRASSRSRRRPTRRRTSPSSGATS